MGYHPRIESSEHTSFNTIRCKNSRLWFVNNPKLEKQCLAYTAKYAAVHNVELYAMAIEGSHIHDLADFPDLNRADFMRDRNSVTAKLVIKYCEDHEGGRVFERRYSAEILFQNKEDIEEVTGPIKRQL